MSELDGATPESTEEVTPTETPVETTEAAVENATPEQEDFSSWTVEDAVSRLKETREEAKRYRTERNSYKDAFEGFEPEDVELYLSAVKNIRENPAEAHSQFAGLVEALAESAGITTAEAEEIVEDELSEGGDLSEGDELLTKAGLDEYLAKKAEDDKAKSAADEARKEIDETISELGYKPDTADFNNLLFFATKETEGSAVDKLKAADAVIKAEKQSIIDNFLAEQGKIGDSTPPQSNGAAPTPAGPEKVKSINGAAKQARAALDAMFSQNAE